MATRPKRAVKKPAPSPSEGTASKPAKARGKTAQAAPADGAVKPKAPSRTKAAKPGRDGAAAGRGRGALVIVESPTKAKTIGKYLGSGYDVKATVGHLRDLPTRELGVDVERGFEPKYVTIKGKTKTLAELKKAAKAASTIYLATDPDREGEAIAWHVADQINSQVPVHRVLFEEITRDAVLAAMEEPKQIDERKVDAQQARRILDRLVGYKASPILWRTIKTGLSAGRVQTVALRLIVEREREIRAFKSQEYWTIEALCEGKGQTFEASLVKLDGHKPQLHNEADARAVVDAVRALPFVVTKVEQRRRNKRPGAPFTTSTIQQEAAKKLGFSSRRTMRAAQDLYEGIDVGEEGPVGLITYMRTDSVRVADTAVAAARELIGEQLRQGVSPRAAQRVQRSEERPSAGRARGDPAHRRPPAPRPGAVVSLDPISSGSTS